MTLNLVTWKGQACGIANHEPFFFTNQGLILHPLPAPGYHGEPSILLAFNFSSDSRHLYNLPHVQILGEGFYLYVSDVRQMWAMETSFRYSFFLVKPNRFYESMEALRRKSGLSGVFFSDEGGIAAEPRGVLKELNLTLHSTQRMSSYNFDQLLVERYFTHPVTFPLVMTLQQDNETIVAKARRDFDNTCLAFKTFMLAKKVLGHFENEDLCFTAFFQVPLSLVRDYLVPGFTGLSEKEEQDLQGFLLRTCKHFMGFGMNVKLVPTKDCLGNEVVCNGLLSCVSKCRKRKKKKSLSASLLPLRKGFPSFSLFFRSSHTKRTKRTFMLAE